LRRWIATILPLAGIAVAALAIADVGPFEDPVTEDERAQQAVDGEWQVSDPGSS
jgi:hypothetical protein